MAGFKPGTFQCYYPSQRRLVAKNSNVAKESVPRNSENDLFELLFSIALLTPSLHAKTHSRSLTRSKYSVRCKQQGVRHNRFSDVPKRSWGIDIYKR